MRAQLRRATARFGPLNSTVLSRTISQPLDKETDQLSPGNRVLGRLHLENVGCIEHEIGGKMDTLSLSNALKGNTVDMMIQEAERLRNSSAFSEVCVKNDASSDIRDGSGNKSLEEVKKSDTISIPADFLCPISLELMRDPVIVSTGQVFKHLLNCQDFFSFCWTLCLKVATTLFISNLIIYLIILQTYERSYIQRWIDCGNVTCPKTQQKLQNLTLTPNYVLRSLISQWCAKNNIEQPNSLSNGKLKKSDGSIRDVSEDLAAIQALVRKLSSQSIEERRAAVTEIRSLSKRNTDNRILIAEAGAIPVLVNLLTSDDVLTQENAVTSVLNLSIYENNKGLIMLAGAVPSIVQVLRAGTMESRENAAATLFSLSLADENKIIIGASGAIPALVDLLRSGSARGKKDAATALFNLCIYHGNKGRAVRAGIIPALLRMLTDNSHSMVDEALTILSVLAGNQEAKAAIVKASTIPVLVDLLRTGLPRNKENAAAILLSLCKRDNENLASISRLGAVVPLTELARNGTERAKRKAASLLEHIRKSQQP